MRLEDVDPDGHLDGLAALGETGQRYGSGVATFVAQATPDGGFALDDEVARAFLRRGGCRAAPTRIYAAPQGDPDGERDGSDALFRGVCARAHGSSAERVQLQALADLRALGPAGARFVCNDLEWLSWRILIGPPTR